jgi:prepilin-type processing-associated H-X9-DG protein
MGGTRTAYQCPVHAEAVSKLLKRPPGWSYAMNREFGHEKTGGNKWHAKTKEDPNSAKILMFAELQGANISGRDYAPIDASSYIKAGAPLSDAVLDYDTESIGFNHKIGSRGFAGHVAFTDGHVEKLFYPKSGGGGLSLLKLTEALCKGHEISYDGRGYKDLQQ